MGKTVTTEFAVNYPGKTRHPLDPARMRETPVPLHDSARRAYDDLEGEPPLTDGLVWT